MTTDNDRDIFLKAIDVLEVRGWIQGDFTNDEGVCLIQALWAASAGRTAHTLREMRESIGLGTEGSLIGWNDAPERTYEDVVLALKRAAHGEPAA